MQVKGLMAKEADLIDEAIRLIEVPPSLIPGARKNLASKTDEELSEIVGKARERRDRAVSRFSLGASD